MSRWSLFGVLSFCLFAAPALAVTKRTTPDDRVSRSVDRGGMPGLSAVSTELGGNREIAELGTLDETVPGDVSTTGAAQLERTARSLESPPAGAPNVAAGTDAGPGGTPDQQTLARSFDGVMALPSGRSLYVSAENLTESPVYVLLHGLGRDSASLGRIALRLKRRGFGVVGIDLHGHGRTPDQHRGRIPYDHNVEDVAAVLRTLDLRQVRIVGHSYGGFISLMLGAERSIAERLESIFAIVPYVQHLGRRIAEENAVRVGLLARLNPASIISRFWSRVRLPALWSAAWKATSQAMAAAEKAAETAARAAGDAAVSSWQELGVEYIRQTRGEGAAAATAGLPDDIIANPPRIAPHVAVHIILGRPGSMAPNDLQPMLAQIDSDEMAFEFVEALRGRGILARILRAAGSHMVVYERPDEITDLVAR